MDGWGGWRLSNTINMHSIIITITILYSALYMSVGISSISDAIASFLKPEHLSAGNEWKCDKCLQRVKVRRHTNYDDGDKGYGDDDEEDD